MFKVLAIFVLALGVYANPPDPAATLAEVIANLPRNLKDTTAAIDKLKAANSIWEQQNSKQPLYAVSLEYVVGLLDAQDHFFESSAADPAAKTYALSLIDKAIALCTSTPDIDPAILAQALEMKSDIVGEDRLAPASLWSQASALRARIVSNLPDIPRDPSLSPSETLPPAEFSRPQAPHLVSKQEPRYSNFARMKKVSGSVSLSIVIDSDGIPRRIRLLKGIGYGLDEEAVAAVQKWRFAPGMKEGHPVPTPARVEVTFRLL